MSTCPQCAQLLSADASHCPACGHDLHARRLPPEEVFDRDPDQDREELLTAAIAAEGTERPPPPWVAPLEDRVRPAERPVEAPADDELRDVVPTDAKKSFWRRH